MKKRFLFIHEVNAISPETVFYCVWIGDTARDQLFLRKFTRLAQESNDYYFKVWNDETENFFSKIARSLFPNEDLPLLRLNSPSMTAVELNRIISQGKAASNSSPKGTANFLSAIDPHFRFQIITAYRKRIKPKANKL